MAPYFGDIRDRFDEVYPTSASFVVLPNPKFFHSTHIRFNVDIYEEQAVHYFRRLCYAYEDSYNWSILPLVFDEVLPRGIVRWQIDERVVRESPIDLALKNFDQICDDLLKSSGTP